MIAKKANKIIIGIGYNRKTNKAENLAIYDIKLGKTEIISTKLAKDKADAKQLSVINANLGFFVNSVDMTIGEQYDYPVIFFTDKKTYSIENAVIVFDPKPEVNDNKEKLYKCIYIVNNTVEKKQLSSDQLIAIAGNSSYKKNYFVEGGVVKFKIKENSNTEVYVDDSYIIKPIFEKWYKLVPVNGMQEMVKVSDCNVKTFSADGIEIIDGFTGSESIEEVDLSGAVIINPKAFDGCPNLKKVILSDSLVSIGDYAFRDCKNLKEIDIPKTAKIGSRIFDNGTAYLHKDLYGVMTPFGQNVKIIVEGKALVNETLQVAVDETDTDISIFEIDTLTANVKKTNIKKKDIGPLDIIINYKTEEDRMLTGDIIIVGLTGNEYVCLDKNKLDDGLLVKSFDDLSGFNISDGMIIDKEYQPINPDWGWNYINIVNSKNVASSKIGAYVAATSDNAFILTDSQKMLFGEYIAYKFKDMFSNISIRSMRKKEKVEFAKTKYEGYTFKISDKLPMIPGGLAVSDNPKKYDKSGKEILSSKNGLRFCYFGHPTKFHWIVTGTKEGERDLTFTFGKDCFADFLGIDRSDIDQLVEFEEVMAGAVDEIEKAIKNKTFKDNIKNNLLFYEMMKALQSRNDNGFYTNLGLKFLNEHLIIPTCIREDICVEWCNGKTFIAGNYSDSRYTEEIYEKVIPEYYDKLHILYNYPVVKVSCPGNTPYMTCSGVTTTLENIIQKELKSTTFRKSFTKLKELKSFISKVKIDNATVKQCEAIRKKFDSIGLPVGEYCLDERWYINTRSATIYEGDDYSPLCSLEKEIDDVNYNAIKDSLNKEYRPTSAFTHMRYNSVRRIETQFVKDAKLLLSLLNPSQLKKDEYAGILFNDYYRNSVLCAATQDFIISYGITNSNKPIMLVKNNKINYTDNYGMFDTTENKYGQVYRNFIDSGIRKGAFIYKTKTKESKMLVNGKGLYKTGDNGIKYLRKCLLENVPKDDSKLEDLRNELSFKINEDYINNCILEIQQNTKLTKDSLVCINTEDILHFIDKDNFKIYSTELKDYDFIFENGKIKKTTAWDPVKHSMKIPGNKMILTLDNFDKKYYDIDMLYNIKYFMQKYNNHIVSDTNRFDNYYICLNGKLYNKSDELVAEYKDNDICILHKDFEILDNNYCVLIPDEYQKSIKDVKKLIKLELDKSDEELNKQEQLLADCRVKLNEYKTKYQPLIDNFATMKYWANVKYTTLNEKGNKEKYNQKKQALTALMDIINNNKSIQVINDIDASILDEALNNFNNYKPKNEIIIDDTVKEMIADLDKIDQWGDPKYKALEKSIIEQLKAGKQLSDRQKYPFKQALNQYKDWKAKNP